MLALYGVFGLQYLEEIDGQFISGTVWMCVM